MTTAPCRVGTLGVVAPAEVDAAGRVAFPGPPHRLDWWIGADDRWREPGREIAVRQHLEDGAPVVVTALRVPGGDAVQTVYATGKSVVVEIHNDSPAPFVVALVFAPDRGGGARTPVGASLDNTKLLFDGDVVARFTHIPSAVKGAGDLDELRREVAHGVPPGTSLPSDPASVVATLLPVAHRATVRVALPLERGAEPAAPEALDDSAAVARGWATQRDRGVRVEWPDPSWGPVVDAARCELLLHGSAPKPTPEVVAALEDWGHDDEAVTGWAQLGFRARGRARRRRWADAHPDLLGAEVARRFRDASPVATWADGPARFLLPLRALLGRERNGNELEILPVLPSSFPGGNLTVNELPTRRGAASYALRWHGARPAVLWEIPEGTRLRVPGIDAAWETTERTGDALLSPPATALTEMSVESQRDDLAGGDSHG